MKRFVHGSIVLGFLAFAALACLTCIVVFTFLMSSFTPAGFIHALSGGRSIDVVIYHGTDRVERNLPALNGGTEAFPSGYAMSMQGVQTDVHVDENYKVISDDRGHFSVAMHRLVENNGNTTTSDSLFPVWDKEPAPARRVPLADGSTAVAYLTNASTH